MFSLSRDGKFEIHQKYIQINSHEHKFLFFYSREIIVRVDSENIKEHNTKMIIIIRVGIEMHPIHHHFFGGMTQVWAWHSKQQKDSFNKNHIFPQNTPIISIKIKVPPILHRENQIHKSCIQRTQKISTKQRNSLEQNLRAVKEKI